MKKNIIRLKSSDDIKRIRDAGIIISELFKSISIRSLEGISTWELDSYSDDFILKKKARAAFKTLRNYDYASCISINSEAAHGIPSKKRKISTGDLVKVDIGIALKGYFSDACYTFPVGAISKNATKLIQVCRRALQISIDEVKPGARLGDIGNAIQVYTEKNGYNVVKKFAGHGIGFSLHEPPAIPHYGKKGKGMILQEGMVVAIEPIINEGGPDVVIMDNGWTANTSDGKLSAQFEHTIAVTKNGPIVLTE